MRRIAVAFLAVPMVLLLAVGPVAADTSPNGTNVYLGSASCEALGGRQVCVETNLQVFSNEDGSDGPPCLGIFTYSISSNGRFSVISDEFGCASSGTAAIGDDLSVSVGPTQIQLEACGRRTCSASRTVTVSADASPTGPISETTSRSTTKSGGCTTRTTTTSQFADLAGTLAIDDDASEATGFIDVFTSTSSTHCR